MNTSAEGDEASITWEQRHAHRIGQEVQRLRKTAKMTAQQLGDRTERLRLKMTRQAISDLENGRRRYVTTAELVVLAAALNTSPVALLYPGPYDGTVELLPGVERDELTAAQWLSGFSYWATDTPQARNDGNAWLRNTQSLRLSRELESVQRRRSRLLARGELVESDRDQIAFYDNQIERLSGELLLTRQGDSDA